MLLPPQVIGGPVGRKIINKWQLKGIGGNNRVTAVYQVFSRIIVTGPGMSLGLRP